MRSGLSFSVLLLVGAAAWGQSSGWQVLERAALADPAARQAARVEAQAEWTLEAARRAWWPQVVLEAPALASVTGNDRTSSLSTALAATVTQKLPGLGTLSAGTTQTLTKPLVDPTGAATDPVLVPGFSLSLDQPLGPGLVEAGGDLTDLVAQGARLQARLEAQKARRDVFRAVVRRAATLDQAEVTLAWKRALATAADARADLVASWAAQGRATPADRWKADRDRDSARWALDQAQRARVALAAAWERAAGFPAPRWSAGDLTALREDFRTRTVAGTDRALEDDLADLAVDQARRALVVDRADSDPRLKVSTTAQKTGDRPWVFSAQAGVTLSTDGWLTAPVARARGEEEVRLREDVARQGAGDRRARSLERQADLVRTEDYLVLLDRQVTRQAQREAETEALVQTGQLTLADLAAVRADTAELTLEWHQTLWEVLVLLSERNSR